MLNFNTLPSAIVSFAILATALLFGCDNSSERSVEQAPVVGVNDDDERMNGAIAKAQETFPTFEQNWQRPDVDAVSIKIAMETDTDSLEHIWFQPLEINGDQIKARCANQPVHIPGLKMGDIRTVDRSKVSDWMIMESGKCYGGYTIRVLAELNPEKAPPLEFADYP